MRLNRLLIFGLLTFLSMECWAQGDSEPKPLMPTFNFLTLNPQTGRATLHWKAPGYNPLNPAPTGYIIYQPFEGGGWTPIDTVDANTFTYTDNSNHGLNRSITYVIASRGPAEPSPLTPPHSSIYVTAEYDSCGNKIDISWSHYMGWGNRLDQYNVYVGENNNWEQFPIVDTVLGVQNLSHYKVLPNKDYYLYVEGKKENEEVYTRSNLFHINTRVSRPPQYIQIDSLVAEDHLNRIYFSIDKNTEYKKFRLVRWESSDSIASIFTARNIYDFTNPSASFFADTSDSWSARSRSFYYKLNAYDGCNRIMRTSSLANTIIIRAYSEKDSPRITWDEFYSSSENPISYNLYRVSLQNGNPIKELVYSVENPSEFEYIDDLSGFAGQGYKPQFCYYVVAHEQLDNLRIRKSRSRTVCAKVDPDVFMPNALDPLSSIERNGVPRNIFAPTITFDASYKLTVYSRGGTIVYEGRDQGWDGRLPNGQLAPEGTFVYRLEVFLESVQIRSKTGTVTVMYGPQ